jgi:hypothetical protein
MLATAFAGLLALVAARMASCVSHVRGDRHQNAPAPLRGAAVYPAPR